MTSTSERLFYNQYQYRIRFMLRRGGSLLRSVYRYKDINHVLSTLDDFRNRELEYRNTANGFHSTSDSIWSLDNKEVEDLLSLFVYRENFDSLGKVRVECPNVDFYSNNEDYIKRAEDIGIENLEITRSLTEEPNTIITEKLPYGVYNLKCMTKYCWVSDDVVVALLNYQDSGEIKFPWTWETRRMYTNHTNVYRQEKPLPEYIYALNEDSLTMLGLIAGNVINTIYSYKIA